MANNDNAYEINTITSKVLGWAIEDIPPEINNFDRLAEYIKNSKKNITWESIVNRFYLINSLEVQQDGTLKQNKTKLGQKLPKLLADDLHYLLRLSAKKNTFDILGSRDDKQLIFPPSPFEIPSELLVLLEDENAEEGSELFGGGKDTRQKQIARLIRGYGSLPREKKGIKKEVDPREGRAKRELHAIQLRKERVAKQQKEHRRAHIGPKVTTVMTQDEGIGAEGTGAEGTGAEGTGAEGTGAEGTGAIVPKQMAKKAQKGRTTKKKGQGVKAQAMAKARDLEEARKLKRRRNQREAIMAEHRGKKTEQQKLNEQRLKEILTGFYTIKIKGIDIDIWYFGYNSEYQPHLAGMFSIIEKGLSNTNHFVFLMNESMLNSLQVKRPVIKATKAFDAVSVDKRPLFKWIPTIDDKTPRGTIVNEIPFRQDANTFDTYMNQLSSHTEQLEGAIPTVTFRNPPAQSGANMTVDTVRSVDVIQEVDKKMKFKIDRIFAFIADMLHDGVNEVKGLVEPLLAYCEAKIEGLAGNPYYIQLKKRFTGPLTADHIYTVNGNVSQPRCQDFIQEMTDETAKNVSWMPKTKEQSIVRHYDLTEIPQLYRDLLSWGVKAFFVESQNNPLAGMLCDEIKTDPSPSRMKMFVLQSDVFDGAPGFSDKNAKILAPNLEVIEFGRFEGKKRNDVRFIKLVPNPPANVSEDMIPAVNITFDGNNNLVMTYADGKTATLKNGDKITLDKLLNTIGLSAVRKGTEGTLNITFSDGGSITLNKQQQATLFLFKTLCDYIQYFDLLYMMTMGLEYNAFFICLDICAMNGALREGIKFGGLTQGNNGVLVRTSDFRAKEMDAPTLRKKYTTMLRIQVHKERIKNYIKNWFKLAYENLLFIIKDTADVEQYYAAKNALQALIKAEANYEAIIEADATKEKTYENIIGFPETIVEYLNSITNSATIAGTYFSTLKSLEDLDKMFSDSFETPRVLPQIFPSLYADIKQVIINANENSDEPRKILIESVLYFVIALFKYVLYSKDEFQAREKVIEQTQLSFNTIEASSRNTYPQEIELIEALLHGLYMLKDGLYEHLETISYNIWITMAKEIKNALDSLSAEAKTPGAISGLSEAKAEEFFGKMGILQPTTLHRNFVPPETLPVSQRGPSVVAINGAEPADEEEDQEQSPTELEARRMERATGYLRGAPLATAQALVAERDGYAVEEGLNQLGMYKGGARKPKTARRKGLKHRRTRKAGKR